MTEVITTMLASALDGARAKMVSAQEWPDSASGLAYRILTETGNAKPEFMEQVPALTNATQFRRTPNLAAYGYVIDKCDAGTCAAWLNGIEHLRGRDIYPADGQSFIFNPVEILGVAAGLAFCASAVEQAQWFVDSKFCAASRPDTFAHR